MGKIRNNQSGFSVVETVLILVIIGLLGFVGWYVYHAKQTSDKNLTTSSAATPKFAKKTTTKTQTPDPYANWQSYCDTRAKACFKYPQGWNLEYGPYINTQLNSPDAQLAKFSDSDQKYPIGKYTVQMHLGDTDSAYGTSGPFSFTTQSIEAVTDDSQLRVVGGYDPSANIASYSIVDNAFIQKYELAVGKTSQNVMNLSYADSGTSTSFAFFAEDASLSGTGTYKNVSDWFKTDYAKQSLLVLKSYKSQ